MKEKRIKVLKVEPGKAPEIVWLKNTLHELQKAVSIGADYVGLIEIINLSDKVCILCNEEAKLIGLEPNRRFYGDILCGTFYVTGQTKDGQLASLPEEAFIVFEYLFAVPEVIPQEEVSDTMFTRFTIWEGEQKYDL